MTTMTMTMTTTTMYGQAVDAAGPDNATAIVWAFGMFFFLLFSFTLLTTNFFFFFFDCDYNDYDNDNDYVGSRCRRGRPRRCNGHCLGLWYVFFFTVTLLLLVTNYDIVFRFL